MNIFKYVWRQLCRLKIDLLTQRTFLAGDVLSIDNDHIIKTANSNYEELEIIFFKHFQLQPADILVDVGCGKGRVFNYLLYKGLKNQMIGYEINPAVGKLAKKRLARFDNVGIRVGNIFNAFPAEGNVFYLYHPFKETMMTDFRDRLLTIADRNPVMIYNNPVLLYLFDTPVFSYKVFDVAVAQYGYSFKFAIIKLR